jgi:hypothetical protein
MRVKMRVTLPCSTVLSDHDKLRRPWGGFCSLRSATAVDFSRRPRGTVRGTTHGIIPAQRVPSAQLSLPSLQLAHSAREAVLLVNGGSAVRSRSPAPCPEVDDSPLTCVNGRKRGRPMAQPAPARPKISWVGPGRPARIAPGGFPRPARRTRRATLTAPGAPRVLPAGVSWLPGPAGVPTGPVFCCRGSGSG